MTNAQLDAINTEVGCGHPSLTLGQWCEADATDCDFVTTGPMLASGNNCGNPQTYDIYEVVSFVPPSSPPVPPPPSPPPSSPPPLPPSCQSYTAYSGQAHASGWANSLFELTNGAAVGQLGNGFTRQVIGAHTGAYSESLVEKCCSICEYGEYDSVSYTFHSDQAGNNVASCASFELKFIDSASFGWYCRFYATAQATTWDGTEFIATASSVFYGKQSEIFYLPSPPPSPPPPSPPPPSPPPPCDTYTHQAGIYIPNFNHHFLSGPITVDECKTQCCDAVALYPSKFTAQQPCVSFDYNVGQSSCNLSWKSTKNGGALQSSSFFDYYEKSSISFPPPEPPAPPPTPPPSSPLPPAYPTGAGANYFHMDEMYYNWVVESQHYLGKTSTLSPSVYINMRDPHNWDPVDVCGYLCTTNAPAHPTRGVCKQFYVSVYEMEYPTGTLQTRAAECTFMNEHATATASLPGNAAWQNVGEGRQRYVYDAYSINHPPPSSPPPASSPSPSPPARRRQLSNSRRELDLSDDHTAPPRLHGPKDPDLVDDHFGPPFQNTHRMVRMDERL